MGVKLKKVDFSRTPIEYELTPYEILMDDIRSRRYKLRKVMIDGNIPPKVKKDAHAVILDFIRARPPLRKVRKFLYIIFSRYVKSYPKCSYFAHRFLSMLNYPPGKL